VSAHGRLALLVACIEDAPATIDRPVRMTGFHLGRRSPGALQSFRLGATAPEAVNSTSDRFESKPPTRLAGKRKSKCGLTDAEPAVAAFVPADKQDEILMPLRLDRALLELFAVRRRNTTAHSTAKAKYGLS
jgi:hypothetical protein